MIEIQNDSFTLGEFLVPKRLDLGSLRWPVAPLAPRGAAELAEVSSEPGRNPLNPHRSTPMGSNMSQKIIVGCSAKLKHVGLSAQGQLSNFQGAFFLFPPHLQTISGQEMGTSHGIQADLQPEQCASLNNKLKIVALENRTIF